MKSKAVGYCRVSTEEQISGTSLDTQRQAIEREAEHRGYELIKVYSDEGISGAKYERPALQEMLKDAEQGKFEMVFYTSLTRLSRSTEDVYQIMSRLDKAHVASWCIEDPSISTGGKTGKLLLAVLSGISEFERESIKERCTSGLMSRWRSGMVIGTLPFGFEKDEDGKPRINETEAEIYRLIVKLYLTDRLSTKGIAAELTKRGIPTRKRSSRWAGPVIASMLGNPAYSGEAILAPKQKGIPFRFPQIISVKQWQDVHKRIEDQKVKPRRSKEGLEDRWLFNGYLYCGLCGSKIGKSLQGSGDKPRLYYSCALKQCGRKRAEQEGKKPCDLPYMNADTTDHEIYTKLIHILVDPSKYIEAWLSQLNPGDLQKQKTALEKRERDLANQIRRGFDLLISTDEPKLKAMYGARQDKIRAEWERIRGDLDRINVELDLAEGKKAGLAEMKKALGTFKGKGKLLDIL